ncbi:hypothetical protein B0H14DRAFT_3472158 [Mycena olivaceomarginata]|nr:hypothetical protein B0H14DRAFT_3472158 [Mycena olivaceomarginata]
MAAAPAPRASWVAARGLNASCDRDFEPLQALPMPLALIPVPVAPAPPAPGAALVLPAPFVAPPVALPPPHILFPANKGALRGLTRPQLSTLLLAYNEPVPAATAARRAAVARLGASSIIPASFEMWVESLPILVRDVGNRRRFAPVHAPTVVRRTDIALHA